MRSGEGWRGGGGGGGGDVTSNYLHNNVEFVTFLRYFEGGAEGGLRRARGAE